MCKPMKKSWRLNTTLGCVAFLLSANVFADDYTQWSSSAVITLNTTATGANITTNVINFPVLIRLNTGNFPGFATTLPGGADIRFTKINGVHLAYQIERWVDGANNNDTAEIWVRLDTVFGNRIQTFKMLWGKTGAPDSSSGRTVFDTANGFQAAWHLGEAGTGNTNDATINNYSGIASGATKPVDAPGVIGRAKNFNGTATAFSYFDVAGSGAANSKLNFPQAGTYTISAWVNTNNVGDGLYHDYLAKGDHQYSMDVNTTSFWQYGEFQNNVGWNFVMSTAAATAGTWTYVTGIRNGAAMNFYVNGALVNATVQSYAAVLPRVETFDVSIGWNLDTVGFGGSTSGTHQFNGKIDELVLANKARTADWIKLCYTNQRTGQTVTTIGSPPTNFTYKHNPVSYSTGTAITPDSAVVTGAVDSFTVTPPLPAGLNFAKATGIISGTPSTPTAAANYAVTARNAGGSATVMLSIAVTLAVPSNLSYKHNPLTGFTATPITPDSAVVTGTVDSFTVSPPLPAGLSIARVTGIISGTPNVAQDVTPYTITARNTAGSTTVSLPITITTSVPVPSNLTYQRNPLTCVTGTPITPDSAKVTGTVDSFIIAPPLPAGLSIAKATGVITGTPIAAQAATPYTVTAKNVAGSTTAPLSIAITLPPAKAYFTTSATTGKIPLSVTFTDSSSGVVTRRIWSFGDNSALDSSVSPVHVYTTEGTFNAKLVVVDGAGKRADSMTVLIRTYKDNPLLISGKVVSPGKIEVTYSNYSGLPTGPLPMPFADSIALCYQPTIIPISFTGSIYAKNHYLATVQTLGKTVPFKDTVLLPQVLADSVYGFLATVHWSDGTWSKFATGNGCLVLVKDTGSPVNLCGISGRYIGTDSAAIVVSNMKSIDTSAVDTFSIWYGTSSGDSLPDFGSGLTRWYNLKAQYGAISAAGRDSIITVNALFNAGVVKTLWCAVILRAKNDKFSQVVKSSFQVGINRPSNPIVLSAVETSASRIQLSWPVATGVDGIRIVYRAGSAIPVDNYYFDSTVYIFAIPAVTDASLTITGLTGQTHYFFGAQVYKGGLWSVVTQASMADAVTPQANPALSANRVKVDSLSFDPVTNQINVFWKVSGATLQDSLQAKILCSTTGYPDSTQAALDQSKPVPVTGGSAMKTPINVANLQFNTKYYVSLWESKVDGASTPPTDSSRGMVTTSDFTWQQVAYFTKVGGDTAFAFNNSIRLVTDSVSSGGDIKITDKVSIFRPDPGTLSGFIPASIAFKFALGQSSARFYVGLKFATLPGNYVSSDLRVYRFRDSVWAAESTVTLDAANGYVSVKTNDLSSVFMVMLDTQAVTVNRWSHVDTVPEFTDCYDTVDLSDNAANVKWRFMCAKGGDASSAGGSVIGASLGYTRQKQIIVHIPNSFVTQDNGVRAKLVVTDGVNTTVRDFSRQVRRLNSDLVRTEPMKWLPLRVTAQLDNPLISNALRDTNAGATPWTYDTKKVRLFKWNPNVLNAGSDQKWVEYSGDNADAFKVLPGGLIWIKTREETEVNFGSGVTLPLSATQPVVIAPNTFTDIALPYKFNIKIGDIIDSTKTGTLNADSLQIYSWERDSSGVYSTQPLYIADLAKANLADKSSTMACLDLTGYSVRNPMPTEQITLRVPPIPEAVSQYGQGLAKLAKRADKGGWAIKVSSVLSNGTRLTDLYCVYDPAKGGPMRYYPLGPTFGQSYVALYDADKKKLYGNALTGQITKGGCAYQIAYVNQSQAATRFSCSLLPIGTADATIKARIYDEASGRYEDGQTSVTVAPGETQYRWLFTGSEGYLAKAPVLNLSTLRLVGAYPNPFRSMVRIRYSLPASGVSAVKFTICDLRGVVAWHKELDVAGRNGTGELVWGAQTRGGHPVAAGLYILRMSAYDSKQRMAGVFERKLTLLP